MTTIEERSVRRHRGRCHGAYERHWHRPTTALGRLAAWLAHVSFRLLGLVVTVTLIALVVAATVATWRWIFDVLT